MVREALIQANDAVATAEDEGFVLRQDRAHDGEEEVLADYVRKTSRHRIGQEVDLPQDAPADLHEPPIDLAWAERSGIVPVPAEDLLGDEPRADLRSHLAMGAASAAIADDGHQNASGCLVV